MSEPGKRLLTVAEMLDECEAIGHDLQALPRMPLAPEQNWAHDLPARSHKRHSWVWHKHWRFWLKPAQICLRCSALLRREPAGPRGGKRYSYREVGTATYLPVDRLPECRGRRIEDEV